MCYHHGGATPRGFSYAHTKHGRYSKDLPTLIATRYREAIQDPDVLILREEIALLDVRIIDVLKRVDTGESGQLWGNLQKAWGDLLDVKTTGDPAKQAVALDTVGDRISKGQADWATWGDVRKLLQERRALVESERKRLVEMQQVITAEQAMTFLGASVLCPGFVNTNIFAAARNRPAALAETAPKMPGAEEMEQMARQLVAAGSPPSMVADVVFEAIRNERFYIMDSLSVIFTPS